MTSKGTQLKVLFYTQFSWIPARTCSSIASESQAAVPPPASTGGADLDFCLPGILSPRPLCTHLAVYPENGSKAVQGKTLSPPLRNAFQVLNLSLVQPCVNQAKRNSHKSQYGKHVKVLPFTLDLIQSLMGSQSLSLCFQSTPCP